jgi:anti-sigma factor RsiW
MNCQELPLNDFADGLLHAESRAAVTVHLQECPACAEVVERLREAQVLLQGAEPVVASEQFERRLETRLRQEGLKREGVKLLVLGLAAVAVFLRLLLGWVGGSEGSTTSFPEG